VYRCDRKWCSGNPLVCDSPKLKAPSIAEIFKTQAEQILKNIRNNQAKSQQDGESEDEPMVEAEGGFSPISTEVKLKRRLSFFDGPLEHEIYNPTFFEKGYDHTLLTSL
jgi:hypothetical protein